MLAHRNKYPACRKPYRKCNALLYRSQFQRKLRPEGHIGGAWHFSKLFRRGIYRSNGSSLFILPQGASTFIRAATSCRNRHKHKRHIGCLRVYLLVLLYKILQRCIWHFTASIQTYRTSQTISLHLQSMLCAICGRGYTSPAYHFIPVLPFLEFRPTSCNDKREVTFPPFY